MCDSAPIGHGFHVFQQQSVLVHRVQQRRQERPCSSEFTDSDKPIFLAQILRNRLHVTRYYLRYLKPFNSAVNVFCTLTLYLGLLLNSCYITRQFSSSLLVSHLHMVAALFFGIFFGSVYSQPGLRNTAITFLVLYAMQLSSEYYFKYLFANMVVYVFLVSVTGFFICMWLNMNPEFVM